MIMATMPESSSTITSELRIENQCTWSSPMYRYRSQREAHAMSECSHTTSYVKMTSLLTAGMGGRSGRSGTEVSFGSLGFHSPS